MILALTFFELSTVTLVLIFVLLAFRLAESNWSYRISKPHAWEAAAKAGKISKKLKRMERFYRDKVRFYTFWLQIERLKKDQVPGAFAEVGVYRGETAKLIHEMDNSRKFHLFDTFSGFNERDVEEEKFSAENRSVDFSDTNQALVLNTIDGNENILLHKGYFPGTAYEMTSETYAFVHLDADLYSPTLTGLHYFYDRLAEGGVMIVHDYNHTWEGATSAVDEFRALIPERFMEIADWQGSAMMVKNKVHQ